ncbi:MAG TPA: alpha/beta hydrolase, partial [Actinomycetota bacterium]|nr:alpha/beta hydrolase [Actinomycetota bacterium]
AGLAAGAAIERATVGRVRSRPDPEAREPFGSLRGTPVGPIKSFDGTLIHVEECGSGPTVVLAHGYSLNLSLWHYQIRDLASRYRLVLFDQRGHGRSETAGEGGWSLEALARDLDAVVEQCGGDGRVVIVGHSMGGMALLTYCKLFHEKLGPRVAGIVLADTTAADVMPGMVEFLPRRVTAAFQGVQEAALRAVTAFDRASVDKLRRRANDLSWLLVRSMGFGPHASPSHVAFLERMLSETPVDTWMELLPAVTGVDVSATLDLIDVPALVIVGTRDRLTPPGAAERMVAGMKRATLGRIAGAGHCPMLETPHTFNARLRAFLDSLAVHGGRGPLDPPGAAP